MMITTGWACAVLLPSVMFGPDSGAYFNPAIIISHAVVGLASWSIVPGYIAAEMLGAMFGSGLAWLFYKAHFDASNDPDVKLGIFCTKPSIKNYPLNFFNEFLGCLFLTFCALAVGRTAVGEAAVLGNYTVSVLIFSIGVSIGGTTGYAINPARDLGPRIMHAILPIPGKRDSNWGYAWLPVVAPILGAVAGAVLFQVAF